MDTTFYTLVGKTNNIQEKRILLRIRRVEERGKNLTKNNKIDDLNEKYVVECNYSS